MAMEVGASWLRADGNMADVVVSSRVRLARNLAGIAFVARASKADRQRVLDVVRPVVLEAGLDAAQPAAQQAVQPGEQPLSKDAGKASEKKAESKKPDPLSRVIWIDLHATPPLERSLLVERHLISKQHQKGKGPTPNDDPRAVAIGVPDERLSIMVNEEDHLRIQMLHSGLALGTAWQHASEVDDRLEAGLDFAYSSRFGYLTACPTNVGTGLRMSVMLHLPGLRLTGEIDKVKRAAEGMSLAVRGFYGEGSEAVGDLFQISNQTTLGKSEPQILQELEQVIIPRVVEYERLSRRELLHKRRIALEDQVWRAWGVLSNARMLTTEEAMQGLSLLRMGIAMGIVRLHERGSDKGGSHAGVGLVPSQRLATRATLAGMLRTANQMMLLAQPSHLQRAFGEELDQEQRRVARARLMRARLAGEKDTTPPTQDEGDRGAEGKGPAGEAGTA
jgi:protein arginine kinase